MDITEKILKLAALGWDGKESELEFLRRVYGIKTEIIPGSNMTEVRLSYKKCYHCTDTNIIRVKKNKKIDPVKYCLRFFRTNNGEPEGPNSALFYKVDQNWT